MLPNLGVSGDYVIGLLGDQRGVFLCDRVDISVQVLHDSYRHTNNTITPVNNFIQQKVLR